jgi:hypothetical protein
LSEVEDQDQPMAPTLDEHGLSEARDVSDSDCIPVETARELRCLCAEIVARRARPLVGLTLGEDGVQPVLACSDVRALVGPGVHIYLIRDDELLYGMRELLGGRLAVDRGAVRIWWPGANAHCDPGDHPAVLALEGEPPRVMLEELAQQLDLTRPRVRGHIRLIEDARAFLEHELARAQAQNHSVHERLRDMQIECHSLRARAEAAEARLAADEHPPGLDRS